MLVILIKYLDVERWFNIIITPSIMIGVIQQRNKKMFGLRLVEGNESLLYEDGTLIPVQKKGDHTIWKRQCTDEIMAVNQIDPAMRSAILADSEAVDLVFTGS